MCSWIEDFSTHSWQPDTKCKSREGLTQQDCKYRLGCEGKRQLRGKKTCDFGDNLSHLIIWWFWWFLSFWWFWWFWWFLWFDDDINDVEDEDGIWKLKWQPVMRSGSSIFLLKPWKLTGKPSFLPGISSWGLWKVVYISVLWVKVWHL